MPDSSSPDSGGRPALPQSVLYSIAAPIGGPGLGTDALETLRGLSQSQILGRAIAYASLQQDIPPSFIRSLRRHPVRLLGFMAGSRFGKAKHYYGAKRRYLDWIASRELRGGRYDLFHGWAGESLRSLREAKAHGIPSVLEIPTWHRNKGKAKPALTKSERERQHLPFPQRMVESLLTSRQEVLEEYDLASLILVLSEKAAETFTVAGVPRSKLFYLPRGVDCERFTPGSSPPLFRAVFVGALIRRKGVHLLLEAWDRLRLKNAELLLVGAIHNEIKPSLEKHGGHHVRTVGFTQDTAQCYRDSTVHVFPSTCEGSAKVTYEAAACGLPQISTREAGDTVIDGVTGLRIPCDDVEALAGAIQRLYDAPELCARMGAAARARMEESFTWGHFRARLLQAYQQAMRQPPL